MTPAWTALALAGALAASPPLVIGHRGTGMDGLANPYPENTLPSIEAAFEEGADMVEVDVQLDASGDPVLWHDMWVPTPTGSYRTHQLAPGDFPVLVGPDGLEAEVPSLRAALRMALEKAPGPKAMDIELKVHSEDQRGALVLAVVRVLVEERAARRVMVSSFDADAIEFIEQVLPDIETGLLGIFGRLTLNAVKRMNANGIPVEWVLPGNWFKRYSRSWRGVAEDAHEAGLKIGIWTVNEGADIRDFAEDGFDLVITDEPDVARDVLDPPPPRDLP